VSLTEEAIDEVGAKKSSCAGNKYVHFRGFTSRLRIGDSCGRVPPVDAWKVALEFP
jgi:hypothetical protein